MKVVINRCYGGFGLSKLALDKLDKEYSHTIKRNDKNLVSVVEELQEKSNGGYADLKVVEIPNNHYWYIEEYDGIEWIVHSKDKIYHDSVECEYFE